MTIKLSLAVGFISAIGLTSCVSSKSHRKNSQNSKNIYSKISLESSSKDELANQLIDIKQIDKSIEQDLSEKFGKVAENLPDDYRSEFFDKLKVKVNLNYIRNEISDIYKDNLSEKQLVKLINFYRSDLGKFISETEPRLNASILETVSTESTREAEKILLKMIKEVENSSLSAENTKKIKKILDLLKLAH